MKKMLALVLALMMTLGCVSFASAEAATSLDVGLPFEPYTLDPALNSAFDPVGGIMMSHLFAGLAGWGKAEDDAWVIVPDCAKELTEGVVNADGTVTYTYTLVDGLKWSDGKDLTAKDFVFAWKRTASSALGAYFGYLFEAVKGYPDNLAVEAPDDKTIVITLNNAVADWNEQLTLPAYFPVREDIVANEAWATDPATFISNGAYTMTGWEHSSKITLTKNANYHNADSVTPDVLECYLSDDSNNMLGWFVLKCE